MLDITRMRVALGRSLVASAADGDSTYQTCEELVEAMREPGEMSIGGEPRDD